MIDKLYKSVHGTAGICQIIERDESGLIGLDHMLHDIVIFSEHSPNKSCVLAIFRDACVIFSASFPLIAQPVNTRVLLQRFHSGKCCLSGAHWCALNFSTYMHAACISLSLSPSLFLCLFLLVLSLSPPQSLMWDEMELIWRNESLTAYWEYGLDLP